MKIVNKGKLLKAIGWTAIGIGSYLVLLGSYEDTDGMFDTTNKPDDNVLDADFTIIE